MNFCCRITIIETGPADWPYKFRHVGEDWQRKTCEMLNLPLDHIVCRASDVVPLGSPNLKKPIKGDGNCFFRSLSYIITGVENLHMEVRRIICDRLPTCGLRYPECADAAYIRNMRRNRTWATDIEIMAAARVLKASIFTWTRYRADPAQKERPWQWAVHPPTSFQHLDPNTPGIYLDHANNNHYDVVLGVKSPEEDLKTRNAL